MFLISAIFESLLSNLLFVFFILGGATLIWCQKNWVSDDLNFLLSFETYSDFENISLTVLIFAQFPCTL